MINKKREGMIQPEKFFSKVAQKKISVNLKNNFISTAFKMQ